MLLHERPATQERPQRVELELHATDLEQLNSLKPGQSLVYEAILSGKQTEIALRVRRST